MKDVDLEAFQIPDEKHLEYYDHIFKDDDSYLDNIISKHSSDPKEVTIDNSTFDDILKTSSENNLDEYIKEIFEDNSRLPLLKPSFGRDFINSKFILLHKDCILDESNIGPIFTIKDEIKWNSNPIFDNPIFDGEEDHLIKTNIGIHTYNPLFERDFELITDYSL